MIEALKKLFLKDTDHDLLPKRKEERDLNGQELE